MALAYASRRFTGRMPQAPSRRMGTWKLAYADFLTALVALFLVLWLVKGVPETGRADLADYFKDPSATQQSMSTSSPDVTMNLADGLAKRLSHAGLTHSVQVVTDGNRVRIDILDRGALPLFDSAGTIFTPTGEETLAQLADIVSSTPWPVSIEGHTDAFPSSIIGMDNWDISTARAQAARKALTAQGLPGSRIESVAGMADTLPLNPGEPHLAANRRVTLVLHVTQ